MYRVIPASSGESIASRGRRLGMVMLVQFGLLVVSIAVGRAVVETQTIHAGATQIALTALGVIAGLIVMLAGPAPCIGAIAALTILRLLPQPSVGGGINVVPADAFFAALVCWWLVRYGSADAGSVAPARRSRISGAPVLIFLGYIGLTLLYVAVVDRGRLSVAFVSWARLLETAALGFLAASLLRTRRDVTVVLGALALAGVIAVGLALAGGTGQANAGPLGVRGGGYVNPDTLGLVAGVLILMGLFGALGPALLHRVPLAIWGVIGVVQAQSVGAIVGVSVALVLGLAFMVAGNRRVVARQALRAAIALAVGVAVAYGVAALIRPGNLPTSQHFKDSSAGQRTVLGAAGLDIAERNPLLGVGWRRSEEPEIIGAAPLNARLRAQFPDTRADFFPDVTPASVHNAYIQVAADAGLIGIALLVFVFVSLGRQIAGVVRDAGRRSPMWPALWSLAWGLVLIVIWWNDNPLYGGQAETVIPAIFVGTIAAISRMPWAYAPTRRSPRRRPQATRSPAT
jgi:O-antigen ligase